MKFKSKYSGREYDLNPILNTDFHEDPEGDLYTVEPNGYCLPQRASDALKAVLGRKTHGCYETCVKHEAGAIKNDFKSLRDELNQSWRQFLQKDC